MSRKCECTQCGHEWWPRISKPKSCPECGSTIWNKPQTTNPLDVKEIEISGEEHSHYGYHYHIRPHPSFSQDQSLSLLMENLKNILHADKFNEERGYFEGKEYRVTGERVSKRRIDDPRYFENILRLTDESHIHVFFEKNEGKDLFIEAIKLCFPNAETHVTDLDDSEIESMHERWRISGKFI